MRLHQAARSIFLTEFVQAFYGWRSARRSHYGRRHLLACQELLLIVGL
jgi:hypothetical protein